MEYYLSVTNSDGTVDCTAHSNLGEATIFLIEAIKDGATSATIEPHFVGGQ
jgi:hypothetical protein